MRHICRRSSLPFVTASRVGRSRRPMGAAWGLAIASKVVADHGGVLTVDSTLGAGTRCVIELPAC